MLEFRVDLSGLAEADAVLRQLEAGLDDEVREAAIEIGEQVSGDAQSIMRDEIYGVEIPFLKRATERERARFAGTSTQRNRGRTIRRWRRTGALLRRERYVVRRVNGVWSCVLTNDAEYAAARNALGGPNPPNRAGREAGVQSGKSPTRPVMWQVEAVARNREVILAAYRRAIERVLNR